MKARQPLAVISQNQTKMVKSASPKYRYPMKASAHNNIKQLKRRAPVNCSTLELINECGEKQVHKLFKEDETCFTQYDLYNVELRELACDNDCPTDTEQINQSKDFIIKNLSSALKEIEGSITSVNNFSKYEWIRAVKSKRHRVY
jgi:hypothetical protein